MKFYRLGLADAEDPGTSTGVEWYASRREAESARARAIQGGHEITWDEIDVVPTKAGILAVLKKFASHPDNG